MSEKWNIGISIFRLLDLAHVFLEKKGGRFKMYSLEIWRMIYVACFAISGDIQLFFPVPSSYLNGGYHQDFERCAAGRTWQFLGWSA